MFGALSQALGLEGVGLRELPPELSSAMAARLGMDSNWGARPGAGLNKGYNGVSPIKPGLGQGVIGAGRQGMGISPSRRTGGGPSGGRLPPRGGQ